MPNSPFLSIFFVASFLSLVAQVITWLVAYVSERFDKDRDLKNETFDIEGTGEYRKNFGTTLIAGGGGVIVGGLVSMLQDAFNGGVSDKVTALMVGLVVYVAFAGIALNYVLPRRVNKTATSELYWSLQKGKISVEAIDDDYLRLLWESFGHESNGRDAKKKSLAKLRIDSHHNWGLRAQVNYAAPGVILLWFAGMGLLDLHFQGEFQYGVMAVVVIWYLIFFCLSMCLSRHRVELQYKYFERRADVICDYKEYCINKLSLKK